MGRWDEDVEARLVGPLKSFHAGAVGPLSALPIIRDGVIDGYLYAGEGEESHKAGVQGRSSGDFEPEGSRYWSGRLRALFEQGVPAHEALQALRGAEGEPGRGRVGSEWRQFATRQELIEFLEPERAARPGRGVRGGRISREQSTLSFVARRDRRRRPTP